MASETVKLHLIDGTISGMSTAEIMTTWTGHVISAPLSKLDKLKEREELRRSGLYILIGESHAYIGEGQDIFYRLTTDSKHEIRSIDKYERIFVITSKDQTLTKGHTLYLEARLIEQFHKAKPLGITLVNKTNPQRQLSNLPESDRADMENFLQKLNVVLPTIGVEIFKQVAERSTINMIEAQASKKSPIFVCVGKGYSAEAQIIDDEFILKNGSKLRKDWKGVEKKNFAKRQKFIENSTAIEGDGGFLLTQDYPMSSPSAAAAIVCGSENLAGTEYWKVKGEETTYGQWIKSKLTSE